MVGLNDTGNAFAGLSPVPDAYRGVWRRTLLIDDAGREDRDTRVFWLQTEQIHIDLRVPADRAGFDGIDTLEALSRDALIELARQQGFAGVTRVDHAPMPTCTWQRQIDFSPPSDARDIGTVAFEMPDVLLEDGIDAAYHERWVREPASLGPVWGVRFSEGQLPGGASASAFGARDASDVPSACFLARTGNLFMYARARSADAAARLAEYRNRPLTEVIADPDLPLASARALLDFEISFGRVHDGSGAWIIDLSTLPWREGRPAFDAQAIARLASWEAQGAARSPAAHSAN